MGLHCLLQDSFLYLADVRTSQETSIDHHSQLGKSFTFLYVDYVRTSSACYGDSFTFSFVHEAGISQETHLWAPIDCYGDSFTFLYVDGVHTS
jgi:hypothetical protein